MRCQLRRFKASAAVDTYINNYCIKRRYAMRRTIVAVTVCLIAFVLFSQSSEAVDEIIPCDPEPTDMTIDIGDIVSCEISVADSDFFRFNGTAGTTIIVTFTDRTAGSPSPDAFLLDQEFMEAPLSRDIMEIGTQDMPPTSGFTAVAAIRVISTSAMPSLWLCWASPLQNTLTITSAMRSGSFISEAVRLLRSTTTRTAATIWAWMARTRKASAPC